MKKAPPVKLSLRKLFVALLAIGPLAILPSPVWATLPSYTPGALTGNSFTVTNGSAVVSPANGSGTVSTITVSDKSVLVWGFQNSTATQVLNSFNIGVGETYSFAGISTGGAVLNKVGYNPATGALATADIATINGTIISGGKVFVLANGAINVGNGATLNALGGTVLSTLQETNDFWFTGGGNLTLTGSPAGSISLGATGGATAVVSGNLAAYSGTITTNNVTITGDLILNQTGVGTGLSLAGAGGPTSVAGNLTVNTNNGAITQVGTLTAGNLTTIGTNGSTTGVSVVLANPANNFTTVSANVAGTAGSLSLVDINDIVLGASTVGQNLNVAATNNVTTSGVVAVTNNVSLTSNTTGNVTFASGSSVGNVLNVATNGGNITVNTVGNLTTGNITTTALTLPVTAAGTGYVTAPTVTLSGTGATGGAATAVVNTTTGLVTGYTIVNNGVGFTGIPTVTLLGGGAPAVAATPGTAATTGTSVTSITAGSGATGANGYVNAPAVSFTGGGGSGAAATAAVNTTTGVVTFTVTNGGTGYTTAPTVVLTGGGAPTTPATSVPVVGSFAGAAPVSLVTAGILTVGGVVSSLNANVTASAASINSTASGATGVLVPSNVTTFTSSAGGIVLPAVTANTLNVTAVGGSVSQIGTGGTNVLSIGNATTNGTLSINAGAGNITLTANNIITGQPSGNATSFVAANDLVTLVGNTASLTNTANITLGSSNLTGNLTINTSPSSFGNGSVTIGNGFGTAFPIITVGGATSITTNGSNVGDDSAAQETFFGSITVNTIGAGFGALGNNVTIGTAGSGFLIAPTVVITGNTGGSNATATASINTTTNVISSVSVTNGGGGFASGSPVLSFVGGGTPGTAATTGAVTSAPNGTNFTVTSVPVTGGGATYTGVPTVTFTGGTAGTGGSNATATAIVNTTTGVLISIAVTNGGNYSVAPTGVMLTGGGNGGQVAPTLTTTVIPAGSVSFTAATNQGKAAYGQFNVTAGSFNVQENTSINLGNVSASSITANSTAGDVLINGAITVLNGGSFSGRASSGNVNEGASGVITGLGNASVSVNSSNTAGFGANLSNTGNSFPNLSVSNGANDIVVVGSSVTVQQAGVGSGNLSVTTTNPGNNITISAGSFGRTATFNAAGTIVLTSNNSTNTLSANNLVLISGDTSATSISQNTSGASQIVGVNGTLSLTTAGGVNLNGSNNPLSGVVTLNAVGGPVDIRSRGNLSVNGTSFGTVSLTSGTVGQNSIPTVSNIILGNLNVSTLTANALNSGFPANAANLVANGAGGNITQATGTILHVDNNLTATTFGGGNIVLANAANSAGRVALSTGGAVGTGGAGSITYSEDATVKLGNIATNATATLTSRFGGIIDDPSANDAIGTGSTLVLSAPNGSVQISGVGTHTAGTTTGNVVAANITAGGAAAIQSSDTITLGATAANSLQVVSSNNIAQSAPLSIFGTANFTATNNITLTTVGNNFGPILLSTATLGKDIVIVENGTLNLRAVTMPGSTTGNFSATSTTSDIISTGFGGVKPGGTVLAPGSGVISLSATNGNISLTDTTNDFPTIGGVAFNAKNVTISALGSSSTALYLGAATTPSLVSGNLTVTSVQGNILNSGNLVVAGAAAFQSGLGNILLTQPANQFGSVKFNGATIQINQVGDMKLVTGSTATGAAQFTTTGNLTVIPGGGSNIQFSSTAGFVAANITLPKLISAAGTLTVKASGTSDLSALSISGDLNGKTPTNTGTGSYSGPQP